MFRKIFWGLTLGGDHPWFVGLSHVKWQRIFQDVMKFLELVSQLSVGITGVKLLQHGCNNWSETT